jgi:hypothetical protein
MGNNGRTEAPEFVNGLLNVVRFRHVRQLFEGAFGVEQSMTKQQAKCALDQIASKANGSVLAVYLNAGAVLRGKVAYDEDGGLLFVDEGRAFVRCEQCATLEVTM